MITDLIVQPHWAEGELALYWKTDPNPEPDHSVTVLSGLSESGWKNVTEEGTLDTTQNSFIHHSPLTKRKFNTLYYRVIIQTNGERWDSPSINTLQKLKPHEFAAVRQMLAHEMTDMRAGNGIRMLLLKPLTFGEPADSYDSVTGQQINPGQDFSGFGERYKNGFFPPVSTYVKLADFSDKETGDPKGHGVVSEISVNARTFCFPSPAWRDLLINPETDDRYTVIQVQPHRFRGIIPVMCDMKLDLLPRDHIRYELNPNNVPDPNNI